jgi:hypothetical protein
MSAYQVHPSVVCTVLEDGGVLLHLDTKFYYSLNRTGLAIWMAMEDGVDDPASIVASRFPDAPGCRESVRGFVAELEREKLVESMAAAPVGRGPAGDVALDGGSWVAPALTRHAVPLSQIMSNPFDPCVPLAE